MHGPQNVKFTALYYVAVRSDFNPLNNNEYCRFNATSSTMPWLVGSVIVPGF
jgi:hypothetical protein